MLEILNYGIGSIVTLALILLAVGGLVWLFSEELNWRRGGRILSLLSFVALLAMAIIVYAVNSSNSSERVPSELSSYLNE